MSKWGTATAKERLSAPASVFCGPGRSFPVADREDYDNAIRALGRAGGDTGPIKACIRRKASANGWPLPESWMSARAFDGVLPATFALPPPEPDASGSGGTIAAEKPDTVIRRGKVFEAGNYPDKDFAASVEDLVIAAMNFQPVDNDLEHIPTILSGHLGKLTHVALSEDGGSLIGEVEIPRWLHDAIGDAPIKTSLSWDKATMGIIGNALVLEPRVPDAALLAAFNACADCDNDNGFSPPTSTAVEETTDHVGLLATIKALLFPSAGDLSRTGGLGQDPVRHRGPAAESHPSVFVRAEQPETAKEDTVTFTDSPEYKAMLAQIAALEARDTERAAREAARDAEVIRERASTWADAEVAAFRALPNERESLVAAFVDAATDDATAPRVVRFSAAGGEEKEGTRIEALRARHAARVPHTLTQEQLRDTTVMMAQRPDTSGTKAMTPERKKYLTGLHGFAN